MPLNPSFAGRTFPPPAAYLVSREKIREFADAIGAPEPAYRDPEAARALGHPDVVAPPTFPVLITVLANQSIIDDPDLGLDFSRVVHGDQRFSYLRPVYAGDRLVCHATVEDASSRAGLDFLVIRTEVRTEADEPVLTAWSKLIARMGA